MSKPTSKPPSPPSPPLRSLALKAAGLLFAMTLVTGFAYPLAMTAIARTAFPHEASGSLIIEHGKVRGSELVGQNFEGTQYLWGRLSATSPPYNAGASAGSNLGPSNELVTKAAKARIDALKSADPEAGERVPVDLVTASGSGLDPHISPAAAEYQVRRVARARGTSEAAVRAIIASNTAGRTLAILGEPRVNVLGVNLELDRAFGK